uniref:MATH domain-containing protein n=1 Tax=Heterorhabditis bacteriophora TaxID=37862 RepID=A0A1I7X6J2_HETBA
MIRKRKCRGKISLWEYSPFKKPWRITWGGELFTKAGSEDVNFNGGASAEFTAQVFYPDSTRKSLPSASFQSNLEHWPLWLDIHVVCKLLSYDPILPVSFTHFSTNQQQINSRRFYLIYNLLAIYNEAHIDVDE